MTFPKNCNCGLECYEQMHHFVSMRLKKYGDGEILSLLVQLSKVNILFTKIGKSISLLFFKSCRKLSLLSGGMRKTHTETQVRILFHILDYQFYLVLGNVSSFPEFIETVTSWQGRTWWSGNPLFLFMAKKQEDMPICTELIKQINLFLGCSSEADRGNETEKHKLTAPLVPCSNQWTQELKSSWNSLLFWCS